MSSIVEENNEYDRKGVRGFVGRNPMATMVVLACVLSLFALFFDPYGPIVEKTLTDNGIPMTNSLLTGLRVFLVNPETFLGIIGMVYFPWTPTIAALLLVGYLGGWRAVRELLSRYRPWQANVRASDGLKIWLVAMLTMIIITGSAALIRYNFAEPEQFTWAPGQFGWLPIWAWFIAGLFTDGGGVGEELGWRGFGSAYLQSKYAPLKAAIFLGLLWAVWHFPARLPELFDDPFAWIYYHIFFTISVVTTTIIMVYFSNRLGGSALIGVMIHCQSNDSFGMRGDLKGINYLTDSLFLFSMLVPAMIVAGIIIYISKGQLAFNRDNPGRQIWTWPKKQQTASSL